MDHTRLSEMDLDMDTAIGDDNFGDRRYYDNDDEFDDYQNAGNPSQTVEMTTTKSTNPSTLNAFDDDDATNELL